MPITQTLQSAKTKKNGNAYFYYYCNDCKIEFRENVITEYFSQFIKELAEYDSVVNQFFLPMIKQKFDEPKEQIEKEMNNQKNRLERIKKAYINRRTRIKLCRLQNRGTYRRKEIQTGNEQRNKLQKWARRGGNDYCCRHLR